jgi:cytochrome c-type biogenesis protein CcmH/NrfG
MSYWKGLMIAVGIDLVWIMGSPILAPDAKLPRSTYKAERTWPMNPENVGVIYVEQPQAEEVDRLIEVADALDSLMLHLQAEPEDVDAIEKVADVYANNGWWQDAIAPLARAIQLDPERWSLWSALDRALEQAGIATITDAELTVRAQNFVEAVEMWGEGC